MQNIKSDVTINSSTDNTSTLNDTTPSPNHPTSVCGQTNLISNFESVRASDMDTAVDKVSLNQYCIDTNSISDNLH